jgi:signal transduction histidine kinase
MELRPASLDDLGLLPTLEWYCREFRTLYPNVELLLDIDAEEDDIPKALKVVLFRLIQQMLQNILRHTNASRAQIQLSKSGSQIQLELTDNCRARTLSAEQASARKTYLVTLRERVTLAGGSMEVVTPDDTDMTTISASWGI